jgi:hypothetical protein
LAAIWIRTLALPTPVLGTGLPIQSTLLWALQEQPGVAVRVMENSAAPAGASAADGDRLY